MSIVKMNATVAEVVDLTPTSKELVLALPEPLPFTAGSFVNMFMDINGVRTRRAFSISSSESVQDRISLTLRLSEDGVMTPHIWKHDPRDTAVEIMGPMGMNTAERMGSPRVFLISFGVGNGVIRSLLDHYRHRADMESIVVLTANRAADDIIHREYFDEAAAQDHRISVMHFVPESNAPAPLISGLLPEHLDVFDFDNADVYVCGRDAACEAVVKSIKRQAPEGCNFFIEGFH